LQQVKFTPNTVLMAESFSGLVAIELLKRQIDLKALIFCASFGKSPRQNLLYWLKPLPLAQLLRWPVAYSTLSLPGINAQTQALLKQALQQVDSQVLAYRLACIADTHSIRLSQTYTLPTFYWHAANDWAVPLSNATDLKAYFPNLHIHTIANSGHFLLQTQPARCSEQLQQTLARLN
jgi:pimeloyl-ACP methyl ester carboxylesterase